MKVADNYSKNAEVQWILLIRSYCNRIYTFLCNQGYRNLGPGFFCLFYN